MAEATLTLSSAAFDNEGQIPSKYTCEGENTSPELKWGPTPKQAQSYALIVDDPDAPVGTFTHWVLFDIPARAEGLPENADEGVSGQNDFENVGYGGPCPPSGDKPHRYFFRLHALDTETLELQEGASREEVEDAMKDHVVATAEVMGTYQRK